MARGKDAPALCRYKHHSGSTISGAIDYYHDCSGKWPRKSSGRIPGSLGETWQAVEMALRDGNRGLPGGTSLAQLLAEQRGVRNRMHPPRLTERHILAWMDAHRQRTGMWPHHKSGPILDAPRETWQAVDRALRQGHRGLPGGSSLSRLLALDRGIRTHRRRAPLTEALILAWADAYHARTGEWPTRDSGRIAETKEDTWMMIQVALRRGKRGLAGDSSLSRLLREHRGVRQLHHPPLTQDKVVAWAEAFRSRSGAYPRSDSRHIPEAPRETWLAVDMALRKGLRSLQGGSSLYRLLQTVGRPSSGSRSGGRRGARSRRVPTP
jgi:hypothetical protein